MAFVFQFLSRWPLRLLHWLGAACGWAVYVFSAGYRHRFQSHVRLAGVAPADARAAVTAAGQMVLELPRLWLGAPVAVQWDGESCIERALSEQRGIIF